MQINVNAVVLALGIAIGAAGASWAQAAPVPSAPNAAHEVEGDRIVAYEYKRKAYFENEVAGELTKLSQSGWELVTANESPSTGMFKDMVVVYLRRPKP